MCGIVGVAGFGSVGTEIEHIRQTAMIFFISSMLEKSKSRGKEASGVAALHDDGSYSVFKSDIAPDALVNTLGNSEGDFDHYIDLCRQNQSAARIYIGHCRKPSVGTHAPPRNNNNNHPVVSGEIIGVHNGTLKNDDEIFKCLDAKRIGDVDSEAIMALLNKLTDNGTEPFHTKVLTEACKILSGSYSVLAFNRNNPFQLAAMREDRPMEVGLIKPLGLMLFASEKEFIKNAVFEYNKIAHLYSKDFMRVKKADFEMGSPSNDSVYVFDLTLQVKEDTSLLQLYSSEKFDCKDKYGKKDYGYYNSYNNNYRAPYNSNANNNDTKPSESSKKTDDYKAEEQKEFVKKSAELGGVELTIDKYSMVRNIVTMEANKSFATVPDVIDDEKKQDKIEGEPKCESKKEVDTEKKSTPNFLKKRTVVIEKEEDNPDMIKKSIESTKKLIPFENEIELAEALNMTNFHSLSNMTKLALSNRTSKTFHMLGFIEGYKQCQKEMSGDNDIQKNLLIRAKKKNYSAQTKIKTLKAVVMALSEVFDSDNTPKFLPAVQNIMVTYPFLKSKLVKDILRTEVKRYQPLIDLRKAIELLEGEDEKENNSGAIGKNGDQQEAGKK